MTKLFAVLFAIVIGFLAVDETHSCTCFPAHPQQQFCWSDFVVRAGVLSDRISSRPKKHGKDMNWFPMAHYEILVSRVFKGAEKIKGLLAIENSTSSLNEVSKKRFRMKVYTAEFGSLCGTTLKKGVKYLLSGHIYGGKLRIGLCNWIQPFRQLTKTEHRGMRGKFDCSCSTAPCWGGGHACSPGKNRCYWNLNEYTQYDSCLLKHGLCARRKNKKCDWVLSASYETCAKTKNNYQKITLP
eukprot:gene6771-7535_t